MSSFKVLVPVDFSEHSDLALRVATTIAQERAGSLFIVYVDIPFRSDGQLLDRSSPPENRSTYWDALEQVVPPSTGVPLEHRVLRGRVAEAIIHFAKHYGMDLIVMSARGRRGIVRWQKGSVVETVVRNAPCPVLTVKQPISLTDSNSNPSLSP